METLTALNQQCKDISAELDRVQAELKYAKEQKKEFEANRSNKLDSVSEFNSLKVILVTEMTKLKDDKKFADQKSQKLREEYSDSEPLKFKALASSFTILCAELVERIEFLHKEINRMKAEEASLLPTWQQDFLKRQTELSNQSAKLNLGKISGNLLSMEIEEKLDSEIEEQEAAVCFMRNRVSSTKARVEGIRRHTLPPSNQNPLQHHKPSVSYEESYLALPYVHRDVAPQTIVTTVTKTLIEEELVLSMDSSYLTPAQEHRHHYQQQQSIGQPHAPPQTYQDSNGASGAEHRGHGEQLWFRAMKRKRTVSGPGNFQTLDSFQPQQEVEPILAPGESRSSPKEWEWDYEANDQ